MADKQNDFIERRSSLRVDMESERVALTWHDAAGQLTTSDAICIDFARQGALLEYKAAFDLGQLIEITFNPDRSDENTVKGQVCRVVRCDSNRYHVAVQLVK